MYGITGSSNQLPNALPRENYGMNIPSQDTIPNTTQNTLPGSIQTAQAQMTQPNQVLASNNGVLDSVAQGAARGLQFVYSDVPKAIKNLLPSAPNYVQQGQPISNSAPYGRRADGTAMTRQEALDAAMKVK